MDGESAADRIAEHTYDLVLLDIMLPGMNGYELLDYIKTTNMPVIFITAMGTLDDKVKGLKAGADDYITKPFEMVELLARVESVLRRYHKSEERIEVDDVIIDIPSRTVTRQGEAVKLTLKEFELLLFLVRNRNIALYRETIYENIWQSEYGEMAGQSICISSVFERNCTGKTVFIQSIKSAIVLPKEGQILH